MSWILVVKYLHKDHTLKQLSSLSCCNTLIVAQIVKNSFNSAYCTDSIVTDISGSQLRLCAGDVRSKQFLACCLYICVFLRCLAKIFSSASTVAVPVPVAIYEACSYATHKEFCSCENSFQQYCYCFV